MSAKIPSQAYARAIFETAQKMQMLDQIYQDFRRQLYLMDESREYAALIRARSMDLSRVQVLEKIFAAEVQPLTLRFLKFLAYKNRLEHLPSIIHEFVELYRTQKGIVALDVTSYGSLDDATLKTIEEKWSRRLGKSVELSLKINPSILGGVIFKNKDQVEDYSIKSQLEQLYEQLMKV